MKSLKYLLLIVSALLILPFAVFADGEEEAEATESKEVNVYLFRGEGCPHCQEAEEWFASIEEEYGSYYNIVDYETWYDKDNAELMERVAEARGEEMVDVLNSAMTGLPIITTIHSFDAESLPHRMGRMMMKSQQKIDFNEALTDIYYHFHFYVYLNKEETENGVKRYISQINYVNNNGKITPLFVREGNHPKYYPLTKEIVKILKFNKESLLYNTLFFKKGGESDE